MKRYGVTLVELLMTMTVMSIVLMAATPSFRDIMMNHRAATQRDAFLGALNYARNTALSQNVDIKVCPIGAENSTTCGASWQNGWSIMTQPTTGNAVLLQSYRAGDHDLLLSNEPIASVSASQVIFDTRGLATTQANFKLCDSRGSAYSQSVRILPTGFIQSSSTMGVAVWNGGALSCP